MMKVKMIVLMLAGSCLMSALISTTEAAPGSSEYGGHVGTSSINGHNNQRDFRSRRGFKTVGLATARGFGKRSSSTMGGSSFHFPMDEQTAALMLDENAAASSSSSSSSSNMDEEETFPVEWLVNYLQKKPSAIRYLVQRLLDRNGDGEVTSSEITSSILSQQQAVDQ